MYPTFMLTVIFCLYWILFANFMVSQAVKDQDGMGRRKTTSGPDKFPMGLACWTKGSTDNSRTKSCCKTANVRCSKNDAEPPTRPKMSCVVNNAEEKTKVSSCCKGSNKMGIGSNEC